jgi:hypothetical protein
MTGMVRARDTREFEQEAVRLVGGGHPVSRVVETLGIRDRIPQGWLERGGVVRRSCKGR